MFKLLIARGKLLWNTLDYTKYPLGDQSVHGHVKNKMNTTEYTHTSDIFISCFSYIATSSPILMHSAANSNELLDLHTTQTQTSGVHASVVTSMFA